MFISVWHVHIWLHTGRRVLISLCARARASEREPTRHPSVCAYQCDLQQLGSPHSSRSLCGRSQTLRPESPKASVVPPDDAWRPRRRRAPARPRRGGGPQGKRWPAPRRRKRLAGSLVTCGPRWSQRLRPREPRGKKSGRDAGSEDSGQEDGFITESIHASMIEKADRSRVFSFSPPDACF